MKRIEVYYEGWGQSWLLATLAEDQQALLFEYSAQALSRGLELSPRHLKLRAGAYEGFPQHQMGLPGLISDALPDGWGMLVMDRFFRKSGLEPVYMSVLDRLAFIGERSLGALTFKPATAVDLPIEDVSLLSLAQDAQVILQGQDAELLKQLVMMGGSPHGARPKVLVNYASQTGAMSTQAFSGAKPWLVKFQAQNESQDVCILEEFYAQTARACGLRMPATQYFDLGSGLGAFGIERFDVQQGMRVPVHTLAGLLHADFRTPGSVDYSTFLRATRFLTKSEVFVREAYERMVFNVLFNNRDDHPKNFSYLLNAQGQWELAPAYDLTFCEGPRGWHQMDVKGEALHIKREHVLQLAAEVSLPAQWALSVIEKQLQCASEFLQKIASLPVADNAIRRVTELVKANQKRLSQ